MTKIPAHSTPVPKTANPTPIPPTPKFRPKGDAKNRNMHWDKHKSKHEPLYVDWEHGASEADYDVDVRTWSQ